MPVASPTLGDPVDVGDLVARVQRDLRGNLKEPFDLLATPLTAVTTDESADVTYGVDQLAEGALVAIDEEILLVRSVSGLTVSLARGLFNTNIAAHAVGAVVEVDPRFFPSTIGDTIVEEIRSWPADLGVIRSADINIGTTDQMIDWAGGPTGFKRLLAAQLYQAAGDHPVDLDVTVVPNAYSTLYPSGYALQRTNSIVSGVLHVVYLGGFTLSSVSLTTTLATIGLPASLYDAVIYGCLWRLLAPREAESLDRTAQPQPRQSSDTPPGRVLSAAAGFKQLRDSRVEEEIRRIRDLYPPRF